MLEPTASTAAARASDVAAARSERQRPAAARTWSAPKAKTKKAKNKPKNRERAFGGSEFFVAMNATIRSGYVQKVVATRFEHVDRAAAEVATELRKLETFRKLKGGERFLAEQERLMDEALTEFANDLELEAKRVANDVQKWPSEMTGLRSVNAAAAKTFALKLHTPFSRRFIGVCMRLDEMFQQLEYLWFAGGISNQTRGHQEFEWHRRLINVARKIDNVYSRARDAVVRQVLPSTAAPATPIASPTVDAVAAVIDVVAPSETTGVDDVATLAVDDTVSAAA